MNPIPRPALPPHARPPAALVAPTVGLVLTSTVSWHDRPDHPIAEPFNGALFPEIRPNPTADPQPQLPLATEGVLRYVWESKFGPMLIEVVGDQVFVNGGLVEQAGHATLEHHARHGDIGSR